MTAEVLCQQRVLLRVAAALGSPHLDFLCADERPSDAFRVRLAAMRSFVTPTWPCGAAAYLPPSVAVDVARRARDSEVLRRMCVVVCARALVLRWPGRAVEDMCRSSLGSPKFEFPADPPWWHWTTRAVRTLLFSELGKSDMCQWKIRKRVPLLMREIALGGSPDDAARVALGIRTWHLEAWALYNAENDERWLLAACASNSEAVCDALVRSSPGGEHREVAELFKRLHRRDDDAERPILDSELPNMTVGHIVWAVAAAAGSSNPLDPRILGAWSRQAAEDRDGENRLVLYDFVETLVLSAVGGVGVIRRAFDMLTVVFPEPQGRRQPAAPIVIGALVEGGSRLDLPSLTLTAHHIRRVLLERGGRVVASPVLLGHRTDPVGPRMLALASELGADILWWTLCEWAAWMSSHVGLWEMMESWNGPKIEGASVPNRKLLICTEHILKREPSDKACVAAFAVCFAAHRLGLLPEPASDELVADVMIQAALFGRVDALFVLAQQKPDALRCTSRRAIVRVCVRTEAPPARGADGEPPLSTYLLEKAGVLAEMLRTADFTRPTDAMAATAAFVALRKHTQCVLLDGVQEFDSFGAAATAWAKNSASAHLCRWIQDLVAGRKGTGCSVQWASVAEGAIKKAQRIAPGLHELVDLELLNRLDLAAGPEQPRGFVREAIDGVDAVRVFCSELKRLRKEGVDEFSIARDALRERFEWERGRALRAGRQ